MQRHVVTTEISEPFQKKSMASTWHWIYFWSHDFMEVLNANSWLIWYYGKSHLKYAINRNQQGWAQFLASYPCIHKHVHFFYTLVPKSGRFQLIRTTHGHPLFEQEQKRESKLETAPWARRSVIHRCLRVFSKRKTKQKMSAQHLMFRDCRLKTSV